jgi:hypothetical protein
MAVFVFKPGTMFIDGKLVEVRKRLKRTIKKMIIRGLPEK